LGGRDKDDQEGPEWEKENDAASKIEKFRDAKLKRNYKCRKKRE